MNIRANRCWTSGAVTARRRAPHLLPHAVKVSALSATQHAREPARQSRLDACRWLYNSVRKAG